MGTSDRGEETGYVVGEGRGNESGIPLRMSSTGRYKSLF